MASNKAEIVKQLVETTRISPEFLGEMRVGTLWNRAAKTGSVPPRWTIRDIESLTVADVLKEV